MIQTELKGPNYVALYTSQVRLFTLAELWGHNPCLLSAHIPFLNSHRPRDTALGDLSVNFMHLADSMIQSEGLKDEAVC